MDGDDDGSHQITYRTTTSLVRAGSTNGCTLCSLLIRQEYKILDEFLERNVTSVRVDSERPPVKRYTHTLVLGQPGIGK